MLSATPLSLLSPPPKTMRRKLARLLCPLVCVAMGPFGPIDWHTEHCGRANI